MGALTFARGYLYKKRKMPGDDALAKPTPAAAPFWFLMLGIAALSMVLGNKYIGESFVYSNVALFFQNGTACVMLLLGNRMGYFPMKPFARDQFVQMTIPAIFMSLQIV